MKIDNFDLNNKVLIVAEIGNNHEGNFELAKEMIQLAADCQADAVKFQTFRTENYVTSVDEKRFKQLKKFELGADQLSKLAQLAKEKELIFLSTPFDLTSAEILNPLVPAFKISSGDNNFLPLLKRITQTNKPVMVSTGMTSEEEIAELIANFKKYYNTDSLVDKVALLHCVSSYPAPPEALNLLSIKYLKDRFGLIVGYSDHAEGILACLAAVANGARIIEKHFTYKKEGQVFKDHLLSADPKEFSEMVKKIRLIESYLGSYKKEVYPCEEPLRIAARRSIAADVEIKEGETILFDNLTWVRPAKGFKPGQESELLGKKAIRKINKGEVIMGEDLL